MELQRQASRRLQCGTGPCPPLVGRVASSSRALGLCSSRAPAPAPFPSLPSRPDINTSISRATSAVEAVPSADLRAGNKFRVVIAGAGIGGLVLAVALLKKGVDVVVLERDLTAIRGEGKYRGPIQVSAQGLPALGNNAREVGPRYPTYLTAPHVGDRPSHASAHLGSWGLASGHRPLQHGRRHGNTLWLPCPACLSLTGAVQYGGW
jgi:hypothetical protein